MKTKKRSLPQLLAAIGLALGTGAALAWYYDVYVYWQPEVYPFAVATSTLGVVLLTLIVLLARGEKRAGTLVWETVVSGVVFTGVILHAVTAGINFGIGGGSMAAESAWIAVPLAAMQVFVLLYMFLRGAGWIGKKAGAAFLCVGLVAIAFSGVWPFYDSLIRLRFVEPLELTEIYENSVEDSIPQTVIHDIVLEHFSKPRADGRTPKCLIVGYDGCRADALAYPNEGHSGILALKSAGGGVYRGYTGGNSPAEQSTSTGPGWATMLTGRWAEEPDGTGHGITGNGIIKPVEPKLIFTQLLEQGLASKTAFRVSWGGHFTDHNATYLSEMAYCAERGLNAAWVTKFNDADVFDEMMADVKSADGSDMLMCIFEGCDHIGHSTGFTNENLSYVKAFRDSDREALALINAVGKRSTYDSEDWLIIISTDHGGSGTSHGDQSEDCRQTFFAVNKPLDY